MAGLTIERLFEHLAALRDAPDRLAPVHDARWREVARWIEQTFAGAGPEAEDARQETLFSVVRYIATMQADTPKAAAKWVSTIHKHKRVDQLRRRRSDPVREALRYETGEEGLASLERVGDDGARPLAPEVLDGLVALVLEHTHHALDATCPSATVRQLRRLQAQATLLRVVADWSADEIARALDYGEPIGPDRLYKWIERGRATVLLGLDRWAAEVHGDELEVITVLRELVTERRADAGRPRPSRRKGEP
ncbi:MAG: hypothetical protein KF729_38225 [Sandaracinaceae bacterium]|nr:hypothetical protein [Sandaracinaceae bacterium]